MSCCGGCFLLLYIHDSKGGIRPIFRRFKYRRLENMNDEEEKYRIKPRRKYARQVWLLDGKAVLVEPIERREEKEE